MSKRIVIISDLHCGSEAGLTSRPFTALHRELLLRYKDAIKTLGARPDILVVNGDAIDGDQLRGKGDGDNDRIHEQIEDAYNLVTMWDARRIMLVCGTPYHVGRDVLDGEHLLASMLRAKGCEATFHRKLNLRVNDWFKVQFRHHIGSSGIPHGRFTPQSRSKVWNYINAAANGSRASHLLVFSHVHYWTYSEDFLGAAMTMPAFQAIGSSFGDRICDGHCDLGAVQLRVGSKEEDGWSWEKRIYPAAVVDRTVRA